MIYICVHVIKLLPAEKPSHKLGDIKSKPARRHANMRRERRDASYISTFVFLLLCMFLCGHLFPFARAASSLSFHFIISSAVNFMEIFIFANCELRHKKYVFVAATSQVHQYHNENIVFTSHKNHTHKNVLVSRRIKKMRK